jgi:hypothetical protein
MAKNPMPPEDTAAHEADPRDPAEDSSEGTGGSDRIRNRKPINK